MELTMKNRRLNAVLVRLRHGLWRDAIAISLFGGGALVYGWAIAHDLAIR